MEHLQSQFNIKFSDQKLIIENGLSDTKHGFEMQLEKQKVWLWTIMNGCI